MGLSAPFGSGCDSIILYPRMERMGTDISVRGILPTDILELVVPFERALKMERNVPGSFLEQDDWLEVADLHCEGRSCV